MNEKVGLVMPCLIVFAVSYCVCRVSLCFAYINEIFVVGFSGVRLWRIVLQMNIYLYFLYLHFLS